MGERLRQERTGRGWSLEYLAQRVGLTKKAISKMELGQTKQPSARNLGKIAEVLHVSVNWLLYGDARQTTEVREGDKPMSMIDCEILATLEDLTDAQKQELLEETRKQAEQNREVVAAYRQRSDE